MNRIVQLDIELVWGEAMWTRPAFIKEFARDLDLTKGVTKKTKVIDNERMQSYCHAEGHLWKYVTRGRQRVQICLNHTLDNGVHKFLPQQLENIYTKRSSSTMAPLMDITHDKVLVGDIAHIDDIRAMSPASIEVSSVAGASGSTGPDMSMPESVGNFVLQSSGAVQTFGFDVAKTEGAARITKVGGIVVIADSDEARASVDITAVIVRTQNKYKNLASEELRLQFLQKEHIQVMKSVIEKQQKVCAKLQLSEVLGRASQVLNEIGSLRHLVPAAAKFQHWTKVPKDSSKGNFMKFMREVMVHEEFRRCFSHDMFACFNSHQLCQLLNDIPATLDDARFVFSRSAMPRQQPHSKWDIESQIVYQMKFIYLAIRDALVKAGAYADIPRKRLPVVRVLDFMLSDPTAPFVDVFAPDDKKVPIGGCSFKLAVQYMKELTIVAPLPPRRTLTEAIAWSETARLEIICEDYMNDPFGKRLHQAAVEANEELSAKGEIQATIVSVEVVAGDLGEKQFDPLTQFPEAGLTQQEVVTALGIWQKVRSHREISNAKKQVVSLALCAAARKLEMIMYSIGVGLVDDFIKLVLQIEDSEQLVDPLPS